MNRKQIADFVDSFLMPYEEIWQDTVNCGGIPVTLTLNGPKIVAVGHPEPKNDAQRITMYVELNDKLRGLPLHFDLDASYMIVGN